MDPHIIEFMYIWLCLGITLHLIFLKKRQHSGVLIFGYELLYMLVEHNLPLDYGFDMPFAVTMRLLIIVTCFACQTGSCIVITTIVYFIIVFLLQPMSRATPNNFESSFDAIIGIFSIFFSSTAVLTAYQWAFAHNKQGNLAPIVPRREDILLKEAGEGIILFDQDNSVEHCNQKALKFLQMSFPESIPAMTLR